MSDIRLVPKRRARIYECFECGRRYYVPFSLDACPDCDEEDNFHLMD